MWPSDKLLATLLVHLRTEDEYSRESQQFIENRWDLMRPSFETDDEFREYREKHPGVWDKYIWPPWRFNDIAGYVEIVYDGRILALAYVSRKRISRRTRQKSFYHYGMPGYGKLIEMPVMEPPTESNVRDALFTTLEHTDKWFAEQGLHLEYDPKWFECLDLRKLLALDP